MRSHGINPHVISVNRRLWIHSQLLFVCILLFTAGVGTSADIKSVADGNIVAEGGSGPTVLLSYGRETFEENPISSFMYFVPLISPTLVDRQTSPNNTQRVGIITHERKMTSKSFSVTCEFEILGKGFHKNTFDPAEMMALFLHELKEGETLTNMLDYIQFEGEGFGRLEITGTITGSVETVTEIDMWFNAGGHKSPVTIGLYDVGPKDGQYKYENRSNQSVARVDRLTFKKTEKSPRMGIKVASISKSPNGDGFWGSVKGVVANLFIRPPMVDKLGNDTMLDFGYALLKQKPAFTFPKAKHIKEDRFDMGAALLERRSATL
jgi:hypothetical protein